LKEDDPVRRKDFLVLCIDHKEAESKFLSIDGSMRRTNYYPWQKRVAREYEFCSHDIISSLTHRFGIGR